MEIDLPTLLRSLKLEQLDDTLFVGRSARPGHYRIYGGEVLGQSLYAGHRTVPDSFVLHSTHAYFVRAGTADHPIIYRVEIIRNGKSFCTRHITASQHDRVIYTCHTSYQLQERGFEHQRPAPEVPPPEEFVDDKTLARQKKAIGTAATGWPIEHRQVNGLSMDLKAEPTTARNAIWLRSEGPLDDSPFLHQQIFAFASDAHLLSTALRPHRVRPPHPGLQIATLDHAIWFHRPFRADDWLLYEMQSPTAVNARGLALGYTYNRDGVLVASVAQEGLIRPRDPELLE